MKTSSAPRLTLILGSITTILYLFGCYLTFVREDHPVVFCFAIPGTLATLIFSVDAVVKIIRRKLAWKDQIFTVAGVALAVVPPATLVFVFTLFRD